MNVEAKLTKLLVKCRDVGIDGVIILPGPNMRYLIDFSLETFERPAFLLAGFGLRPTLLVPRLDEERAREAIGDSCEIVSYMDETGPWVLVERLLSGLTGTVGVEDRIPLGMYRILKSYGGQLKFVEVDPILRLLRVVKNSEEIDRHRTAARILQEAMVRALSEISDGTKERELMFVFHKYAHELGAETSYCLIQSGPNSAKPHMEPTSRQIKSEDIIVFDAAVTFRGYYADITRTFKLGRTRTNDSTTKIFNIVLEAQQSAIHVAGHGVPAEEVDHAARKIITAAGFSNYFIHRTGHGLGVEVHEEPYICDGNKKMLTNGMIFTVEPGIYLPNQFGVRLEDNIIITSAGIENTTKLPKTLNLHELP